MNMIFSHRETVEFRLHEGTTNGQKMVNWLYICRAILLYAEKNSAAILKGSKTSLKDVFNIFEEVYKDGPGKQLSEYLYGYYLSRKEYFAKDYVRRDFVSERFLIDDKKYKYSLPSATTQRLF